MIDYSLPAAATIARAQRDAIAEADRIVDALVRVPDADRTFDNTLAPLEEIAARFGECYGRYGFMAQVGADADVREAAEQLRAALDTYSIDLGFREDVYRAVQAFAATQEAAALTGERRRLLDWTLRDYRRNGFELSPERRERVRALRARLVELGLAFRRNIDSYDDALLLTRAQLAGLPDSYIDRLRAAEPEPESGEPRYRVSLAYPEFFPFLDGAESEELRRELFLKAYRKGGEENVALLEEALAARDEIALLLGYPSWAAYAIEIRMARAPEAAETFLADLRRRIAPRLQADLDELTAAKRAHTGRADAVLAIWDWRYYHHQIRRARYAVDELEVAKYFPLDAVLDGLFDVMQTLLSVRFEPVEPAHAWHEDVRLFRVRDAAPGNEGREIAHFYMDLFPRPHKFGHAAAFTLRPARRLPDGSYQRPVSAILANFTRPSATQPSLLRHGEVVTLFHEFGHILHQTLTTAECVRFSGSRTERDFVEAPSQMLEHWVWLPQVLSRFAHHVETGEPLPESLLQAMVAARRLHAGLLTARQLSFAMLDLAYHAPGPRPASGNGVAPRRSTTEILRELHPICGFPMPEGTYMQAGFGHLFGYDAGYYSYLWSEVFADDMFTRFQMEGPLNPALGLEYRRAVLERGGSVDGEVLLRDFLGRDPTSDAFLANLGIGTEPS